MRDEWALLQQYFRDWYIVQMESERFDLVTFGSLRSETANRRNQNPEKRYIERMHSCIFTELSAERIKDLTKISQKTHLVGYLKWITYRCKLDSLESPSDGLGLLQPTTTQTSTGGLGGVRLSQSELTDIIAQHELYVNTYRWVD